MTKLRILKQTNAMGKPVKPGDVIDADGHTTKILVAMGKAEVAPEGAEKASPSPSLGTKVTRDIDTAPQTSKPKKAKEKAKDDTPTEAS